MSHTHCYGNGIGPGQHFTCVALSEAYLALYALNSKEHSAQDDTRCSKFASTVVKQQKSVLNNSCVK
jgi:hypothetical protein